MKMIEFFRDTKKFDKMSKLRIYTLLRMTRLAKVIYDIIKLSERKHGI